MSGRVAPRRPEVESSQPASTLSPQTLGRTDELTVSEKAKQNGKALGGGSSAVAASSHAACARFRGTDPLITSRTRRALAREVGAKDEFGGIPEARWMRAMTFERLVRDKR